MPPVSLAMHHATRWTDTRAVDVWNALTLRTPLPGDWFSVHPGRHPRESPKALPAPLDVVRRVLVAVHDQPAGGADVGAHAEALVDAFATA